MHAGSTGSTEDQTRTNTNGPLSHGTLMIAYGPQEGEDPDECEEGEVHDFPLGIGTENDLITWAKSMRSDADLFPPNVDVIGIWIDVLPTEGGRIMWEKAEEIPARTLLLEGDIPDDLLADEDIQIIRVPNPTTH